MKSHKVTRRGVIKAATLSAAGLSFAGYAGASQDQNIRNNSGLKGKAAFITGGARGIGLSIAAELAKEGVNITLYDIAENLEDVAYEMATMNDLLNAKETIESHQVKCLAIQGDVRSLNHLEKAMAKTRQEFGRLDIIVANAGVTRAGDLQSHSESMMQVLMDINLGGVAKTIHAATPFLRQQNSGRIVTLSSIAGRGGSDNFSVYAATKWGVIGLTKSVARELGPHNITCNAICPGGIETDLSMNDHMLQLFGGQSRDENKRRFAGFLEQVTPLPGGFMQPVEIAKTACFLCSDAAKCITGSVIDVSSGWNAGNNA